MSKKSFLGIKELVSDRQRLTVFLLFLALSAIIWLLISLGRDYTTSILVPVRYVNFPENKTLLNEVPERIAVNVSGNGYNLIKHRSSFDQDTLEINIDNLNMSMWGEYQRGYLNASEIGKVLQERVGGLLSINRVLTDTLSFVFDLKVSRSIAIKPEVSFSLPQGYVALDSGSVAPDHVEIYGALSLLDTLSHVKTEALTLGQLTKDKSVKVAVDRAALGSDPVLKTDSVVLNVRIDQLTDKRMVIQPEIRNVPDSIDLLIFPNSIEISFQVPLSRFSDISERDFQLSVDYDERTKDIQLLPVNLSSWPEQAYRVKVQPETVEFVITKE